MSKTQRALAALERFIHDHPSLAKRAERLGFRLAARRLNGVVEGLLVSIYFQATNGQFSVKLQPGADESHESLRHRETLATRDHARGSLRMIQLFVVNELRQRGKLSLIGADGERIKAEFESLKDARARR